MKLLLSLQQQNKIYLGFGMSIMQLLKDINEHLNKNCFKAFDLYIANSIFD